MKSPTPAQQCANHVMMGFVTRISTQSTKRQAALFAKAGTSPVEVGIFRRLVAAYTIDVARHGKGAAARNPAYGFGAVLKACQRASS